MIERLLEKGRTDVADTLKRADKSLDTIPSLTGKSLVLAEMTDIFLEKDLLFLAEVFGKNARKKAKSIEVLEEKSRTLSTIASVFAKHDFNEMAEEIISDSIESAGEIDDEKKMIEIFISIGEDQLRVGSEKRAKNVLDKVRSDAVKLGMEDKKLVPLAKLAELESEMAPTQTREDCSKILDILKSSDDIEKNSVLSSLAIAFIRIGEIERSLEMVEKLLDSDENNIQLGRVARTFGIEDGLERAIDLIDKIDNSVLRDSITAELAVDLVGSEKIDKAIGLTERIEKTFEREFVLKEAVKGLAAKGNHEKAEKLLERIEDEEMRTLAILSIGLSYFDREDRRLSKEYAIKAYELAKDVKSSSVLLDFVEGIASMGMREKALELAENIHSAEEKTLAFAAIAASYG